MHAKYQVAIFNIAKVIANVKVGANQPTNQPTDQPTNQPTDQQTGQKQYVPHYYSGRHKNLVILKMYKDCQVLQNLLLLMTLETYCVYPVLVLQFPLLPMNQKKHFVLNATNCSLMEKIGFAVIVVTIGMIGNVLV
ncbi:hypothetical protein DPMN_171179 [Dreissena polymorpha]|uniref:Uncharacterized protein n=1 Tax=Dreissena polymorpha TaxID=45954 RepID=A0A9D4DYQ4_DREPO|nr:hypothetical protein DPMN_171179 [Dreissena polymorpha]